MERIDAIILAGGLGTRLREVVADVPKPLAPVGGKPFLDILLEQLAASGCISRVVLAIGHLADQVVTTYQGRTEFGFPIDFSIEEELLGTGGAVRLALSRTSTPLVLALNGDSFVDVDLPDLFATHRRQGGAMTMVLRHVEEANRFGSVSLDAQKRVISFAEKCSRPQGGLINAGVYLFRRELLATLPEHRVISLERDVFPGLLAAGVYGFVSTGRFIDIGIPETYAQAFSYLKEG